MGKEQTDVRKGAPSGRVGRLTRQSALSGKGRTRVAAYCRVSTEYDDQEGSLEIQKAHFADLIASHPDWEAAGIYYEKISGTHMEARPALGRLLHDCREGRIDLIVAKSLSRFARNTTDLLKMVRMLTGMGIHLIFEKEHLDTRAGDGELILTLLASFAEEESRSISANNRWAIQKRFEEDRYRPSRAPYGYRLREGKLEPDPSEAAAVREIFDLYLKGTSTRQIAALLTERGISFGTGRTGAWSASKVAGILKNEVYLGKVVYHKSYHDSAFRLQKNRGEYPLYIYEDHHPALIEREVFDIAARLLAQRRQENGAGSARKKDPLSGKCLCGICGARLWRNADRRGTVHWVCRTHKEDPAACPLLPVADFRIRETFMLMAEKLRYTDLVLALFMEDQEERILKEHHGVVSRLEEEISDTTRSLDQLRHLAGESSGYRARYQALEQRLRFLKDQRAAAAEPCRERVLMLQDALDRWDGKSFPEEILEDYVTSITLLPDGSALFLFTCGLELKEKEI